VPATADQLTLARSYIGSTETDDVFNERFDRLGPGEPWWVKLTLAIQESIRAQIASLIFDQPTQITVGGDSFNWGSNIKALQDALEAFEDSGGIPDPDLPIGSIGASTARLVRPSVR
jgi:hypothetical protein